MLVLEKKDNGYVCQDSNGKIKTLSKKQLDLHFFSFKTPINYYFIIINIILY
jgi:hypothetical protein